MHRKSQNKGKTYLQLPREDCGHISEMGKGRREKKSVVAKATEGLRVVL